MSLVRRCVPGALMGVGMVLSACGDDIVYRDRVAFEDPPAAAADFLGYSDVESKKTVCGNCHSGKQAEWQQTKHASAWTSLQSSGHAAEYCEGCHTVGALGNVATADSVGWTSTRNTRYYDVQCESCHGAGLTHVMNPDITGNQPLAPMNVDTAFTYGCGECHSGDHTPFLEEWQSSGHARVYAYRESNASCIGCHETRGILAAWGIETSFMEQATTEKMRVTCATCHDPHEASNPGQLRLSITARDTSTNLCMRCHQRRANPSLTSGSGPHSPEGPLLLGLAGWFPPNFEYAPGTLVMTHGSEQNPRLCAGCHVNGYSITDEVNGSTFYATGHTFQATPCVDGATGIPTDSTSCTLAEKSFRACTTCHLSESGARSAMAVAEIRLERLAEEIDSLIPRIPTTEFSTTDGRISTGEGAKFNAALSRKDGSAVHNPFLIEALLIASIEQIQIDYGLTPSPRLAMQRQLTSR